MKYFESDLGTIEAIVNKMGEGELAVSAGDFFRETGEVSIQIPALERPTLDELKGKYSWLRQIERDTSPTDALTLKLGTVLRTYEEGINGTKYERRLRLDIALGYQHAEWLVKHQDVFPAFRALLGKIYIDFPSLVVVDAGGRRGFPCLRRDGRRWCLRWYWLGRGLDRRGRLAVSGK